MLSIREVYNFFPQQLGFFPLAGMFFIWSVLSLTIITPRKRFSLYGISFAVTASVVLLYKYVVKDSKPNLLLTLILSSILLMILAFCMIIIFYNPKKKAGAKAKKNAKKSKKSKEHAKRLKEKLQEKFNRKALREKRKLEKIEIREEKNAIKENLKKDYALEHDRRLQEAEARRAAREEAAREKEAARLAIIEQRRLEAEARKQERQKELIAREEMRIKAQEERRMQQELARQAQMEMAQQRELDRQLERQKRELDRKEALAAFNADMERKKEAARLEREERIRRFEQEKKERQRLQEEIREKAKLEAKMEREAKNKPIINFPTRPTGPAQAQPVQMTVQHMTVQQMPVQAQQPVQQMLVRPAQPQPVQQMPVRPAQPQQPVQQMPVRPVQPQQPVQQPQPVQQMPVRPVQPQQPVQQPQPVQQMPPRPVQPQQPVQQPQPVQQMPPRPVQPQQPVQQPQPVQQMPVRPVQPQQPVQQPQPVQQMPVRPVQPQQPVQQPQPVQQMPVRPVQPQQPVQQPQPVQQMPVRPAQPQQPVQQMPPRPAQPQQPVQQMPPRPVQPQQPVQQPPRPSGPAPSRAPAKKWEEEISLDSNKDWSPSTEELRRNANMRPHAPRPEPKPAPQVQREDEEVSGIGGLSVKSSTPRSFRYTPPGIDLLKEHVSKTPPQSPMELEIQMTTLIEALKSYSIVCTPDGYIQGPTVTLFRVKPAIGVKVSKITSLADDLARYLGVSGSAVRVIPTIPGTQDVGIEIPNKSRQTVSFKNLVPSLVKKNLSLPFALGRTITGDTIEVDIAKTPHLLVAGATGSGKSVCVNSMIASLLFKKSPGEVRMIMIDPKVVELQIYNGIPHLLTPVITEPKKAIKALDFAIEEMERRYRILEGLHVRNIVGYNEKLSQDKIRREKLPYILIIVDEFADLMMVVGKELEARIARLAAKARAVGIHLVLATQRPSTDVVTGTLKNNLPSRIAFRVPSGVDSRTIIDIYGAEKLLGNGDMLYKAPDAQEPLRIQGAFLSDEETEGIVNYCKTQGTPTFIDDAWFEETPEEEEDGNEFNEAGEWRENDEVLLERAWEICVERKGCSTSYIQRRLRIGYNTAARIVEELESRGIVGPQQGAKPRDLLRYP